MARIILALCLLISSVVSAQPGYTNINARYKWIAGGFDSSLILPRYNGVPSGLRSAWNTDGQLAADTTNNRLYVYSGGAWVMIANYSDVSSYTFPYSVVAPGNAIQLENDTTANPANYFYGRNSAGRRGWYPQSSITGVNIFNSDGTLTGSRTVQADGNDFFILNAGDIDMSSNSRVLLEADNAQLLVSDSIEIKPHLGKLKIDTLNNETSQNKLMGWVETTGADRGKVGYVTIGSGLSLSSGVLSASGGSSGITVGTTTITSGTSGRIAYNNAGVYGEKAVTGTGDVVLATSPTLVTPNIGVASGTSLTLSGLTTRRVLYNNDGLIKDTSVFTYNSNGELLLNTSSDAGNYKLQVSGSTYATSYELSSGGGVRTNGSASPELYSFGNTGILGSSNVYIGTSGITQAIHIAGEIVMNELGTTGNFRVEGDNNANLIFTDGTNDRVGIGTASPTARLHLMAGTATANTAPLKFTSGTNLTTAEAGAVEFLTDKFYGTITTSAARKEFTLNDAALTSGYIPIATTNGRLTDGAAFTETTYTPTLTNTTNVAASTAYTTYYQRIGDVVRVWGEISIDATASLTVTELGLSLPIATAIGNTYELAGTGSFEDNTTVQIKGDVTNDRAMFRFYPQTDTNNRYSFSFTYKFIAP